MIGEAFISFEREKKREVIQDDYVNRISTVKQIKTNKPQEWNNIPIPVAELMRNVV